MKIAVWHNLPSGGGKRALYSHVKALKERGHYLEAWTTDMASEDYLPLSDLILEHRKEVHTKYLHLWKIKNPIKRELEIFRLLKEHCAECANEIESKKFDIVFASSCGITNMPFIGIVTKLPCVLYLGEPNRPLHEAMPENIWKAPYPKLRLKKFRRLINDYKLNYSRRLKILFEVEAAHSYASIIVNSLFSRENIIRSYGVDARVCYLGIDTEKFQPLFGEKEPYVVGLGTISEIKSVHKAIEILASIPPEERPVLKWIGNGFNKTYLDTILELAKKSGVDFQFFLNISDQELINLISKAAIMIYTPKLEPFGLAPLEANACGTYVVAIAEGGIKESISNGLNGTLVNGYLVSDFVKVITKFTNDLDYARIKGREAREFVVKNWNEKEGAKNIISEIESLFLN